MDACLAFNNLLVTSQLLGTYNSTYYFKMYCSGLNLGKYIIKLNKNR